MHLFLDPTAATEHFDRVDGAISAIKTEIVDLNAAMHLLHNGWSGAAQGAHADSHERWARETSANSDDARTILSNARAAVDRLVQAEQEALAIWL